MKNILPQEIINLSVENHFSKFSKKSHFIYVTIIVSLVGMVISLFMIKTEITVQSRGIIRLKMNGLQEMRQDELKEVNGGMPPYWVAYEALNNAVSDFFQGLVDGYKANDYKPQ